MSLMPDPYVLRAEGSHEKDAKWVAAFDAANATPATLLSASRDFTTTSWILPPAGAGEQGHAALTPALSFMGHTHFVNFVVFLDCVGCAGGVPMIATGAHDKNVLLFDAATSTLDGALTGHDDVVKCGCRMPDGRLVTGGWDNICIVWDLDQGMLSRRVRAHTNNVTCVAAFGDEEVLSTSGDRTVARWNASTGEIIARYKAHDDTVQAVVSLTTSESFASSFGTQRLFASAGNDSNIFLWNADQPAPIAKFVGHQSIIYNLSCNSITGELLSSGDDNTLRVWRPWACVQCIFHPELVWASCAFPNEDLIATACSDGRVRVWTRNVSDMANPAQVEQLEQTVAATKLSAKLALAGLDPMTLPPTEAATANAGSFEGERTLARDGDLVHAYAWGQGRWDRIGVVVADSNDDGSGVTKKRPREKQLHNGEYYDYLFDVELQGVPLKLAYNRGQSVFDAAQQFIYDYGDMGVSQMDKEMIQNHILNAIEPEDAALVGGAIGGGARAGSGGAAHNYAFSEYAKELAELEAKGLADGKGSYRDEMKRMEAAGEVPAFSTFAQEEAAARGEAGPSPATAAGGPRDLIPQLLSAASKDADFFVGFNAGAASNKLAEFGIPKQEADALTSAVASSLVIQDASIVPRILVAADGLPAGSRFPALDMIRMIAATNAAALAECAEGVAELLSSCLCSTAEQDAERLVALRTASNIFVSAACGAACDAAEGGSASPSLSVALNCLNDTVMSSLHAAVRRATSKIASAPLKAAGLRVMSSLAILLSTIADTAVETPSETITRAASRLVSFIALGLILEQDNSLVRQILRAALVLLTGPPGGNESSALRVAARQTAAKEIFGIVRAKKEYGDPEVVAACRHIYDVLSPIVPP
jgi:phospholipase A-2-activating protein